MEAKKFNLGDLLKKLKIGEIQLPDFQRDWIWDDEKIKSLLESVIRNFPINSIMLLECNADNMNFACRTIEGVDKASAKPQYLILDGQQRLTSLYGALFSENPVTINKNKSKKSYFYYVNMAKAIKAVENSSDVEDMIISVPSNKKLKSKGKNWDLSTPEKEFAENMFPLNKIFSGTLDWIFSYAAYYSNDECKKNFSKKFHDEVIKKICAYEIATIELEKDTSLSAVCKIFEKVNIGGEKLGIFDLLTSIFAAEVDANGEPIKLRKDWEKIQEDFKALNLNVLAAVDCLEFITALTLLVNYRNGRGKNSVSCSGDDILKLKYADYLLYKDDVIDGFIEAGKFLEEEGITIIKYLPYKPQLIPLATLFAQLKSEGKNIEYARKKIRQWYWWGVFSESYRDASRTRCAKDFADVMKWILKREEPTIFKKTDIIASKLLKKLTGTSAVYKGIVSIIFKNGAEDFLVGRNMGKSADYAESIEIHHIFPKKYCEAQNFPKEKYDNIANKTLILKNTNRKIGDNPPSVYLEKIQKQAKLSDAELEDILEKHFIDAELCRADKFDTFIVDRAKKIFDAVEKLTGREISGRDSTDIKKIFGTSLK